MRITVGDTDLEVLGVTPAHTVADLARALGWPQATAGLAIDGVGQQPSTPLVDAPLRTGSVVAHAGEVVPGDAPTSVVEVRVTGGLGAGRAMPLPAGEHIIGRSPQAAVRLTDTTVSARHCRLDVSGDGSCVVSDLGSRNGTRVNGAFALHPTEVDLGQPVQIGAVQLGLARPAGFSSVGLAPPGATGTVAFQRPPRPLAPPKPEPVRVPPPQNTPATQNRFSWAAVLAPVAAGALMAFLFSPYMAVFAALGPLIMIGSWFEDRRRSSRERRRAAADQTAGLEAFASALRQAADIERRRLAALHPDPAETAVRALGPSTRVWERRKDHPDFLVLAAGSGTIPWEPPLRQDGPVEEGADALIADGRRLRAAVVAVTVEQGTAVGVAGPRTAALAVARSLVCQAATHHGPADLRIAILAGDDWDWAKWFPHVLGSAGDHRLIATSAEHVDQIVAEVRRSPDLRHLVVVDDARLLEGRSAVRDLLAEVGGVVIAPSPGRLPSVCDTVVTLHDDDGRGRLTRSSDGLIVDDLLAWGMEAERSTEVARALARLDDPEAVEAGAELPDHVSLLELLDLRAPNPGDVRQRWASNGDAPRVATPVGVAADGVLMADLVADGPHGLLAGTTGSGKSELLRTLVAGLAVNVSPERLTFVLIDYKGGSAFDACADLPHTVGLVTDLDAALGERALRCLDAELRHRERLLRTVQASDIDAYNRTPEAHPLPRLAIVVDEFATLATELPDFVDALVGVAQRGRSLGVHLILATQRPSGAVNDAIRANTNMRISLRVQDRADSMDVLGREDAADIGRHQPGRACMRLGPGDLRVFQAARASGTTPERSQSPELRTRPFVADSRPMAQRGDTSSNSGEDDLARLVRAVRGAFDTAGMAQPRRPWPPPLPERLEPSALPTATTGEAPLGLADDPDQQRQSTYSWDPRQGSMLCYGVPGSGATGALSTLALSLARSWSPDDLHLYLLDMGGRGLGPLAKLAHVGAVVGPPERERQERLVRMLRAELEERRSLASSEARPAVVLLLDDYGAFSEAFADRPDVCADLARVAVDGPAFGISTVATAGRPGAVPMAVAAGITRKLVFALAEAHDYALFGLAPRDVPPLGPGRAIDTVSGLQVHVAQTRAGDLDALVAQFGGAQAAVRRPKPVGTLPADVPLDLVLSAAAYEGGSWSLPVGIGNSTLEPALLRLKGGDHALVAGAARSGKSSVLCAIAAAARFARPDAEVLAVAPRRSPLRESAAPTAVVTDLEDLVGRLADVGAAGDALVLVDDAEHIAAEYEPAMATLLAREDVSLVAAGRADVLRTAYGHWTGVVRRSRTGLALRPHVEMDGELWHTALPRQGPRRFRPGQGYLVEEGSAELLQAARP